MDDTVYWDRESPCTWANAITGETAAAPFAVSEGIDVGPYVRYEVGVMDSTRRLAIHLWREDEPRETGPELAARMAKVYAQLPPFLHRILPGDVALTSQSTGGFYGRYCHREFHTGCGTGYTNTRAEDARHLLFMPPEHFFDDGEPIPAYEEYLLHEIAHMMDFGMGWYDSEEWASVAAKDNGGFVTSYAVEDPIEDFAETFVAWVVYRGYPHRLSAAARRHIVESAKNRIWYFDRYLRRTVLRQWTDAEQERSGALGRDDDGRVVSAAMRFVPALDCPPILPR